MVKFYATEDVPVQEKKRNNPTKLRGNLQPGTILILLSGRHQGKRVVFLKQLESGQLLVTGPYKFNGVPLKRIPQAYTMKTSTSVDVAGVDTSSVTDAYFVRQKKRPTKSESAFFTKEHQKEPVSDAKKTTQENVDKQIIAKASATPLLKAYLGSKFSLKNGQAPHALVF